MRKYVITFLACCFVVLLLSVANSQEAAMPHPKTYVPSLEQVEKQKKTFDDPRPYLNTIGVKQVLPKAVYDKLAFNEDEMKRAWAEVVGFRAPDVVGKIRPEIKPGKYTYKDVQNNPAFKELMWPDLYNRIKPGGPPHAGNIPEFEIIPTRQYYWSLPIAEATKRNSGKTKLDEKGYLIGSTWEAGYPFPKPEGKFKAQQIMYNWDKRYLQWGVDYYMIGRVIGMTKDLKQDIDNPWNANSVRLQGRVQWGPMGFYDQRAKDKGEYKCFLFALHGPRDVAGMTQSALFYSDPNKADQIMMYIPSMRRVRKMSATDTQDPVAGQDQIYDDNEGFMQKLSPTRYPYKYEVVEEREFLVRAPTLDGSEYVASKGMEFKNVRMERRPIYVVKLSQLDTSYVYKTKIFWVDKETFNFYHVESYDWKDRLYRSWEGNYGFTPEMGMTSWLGGIILMRDHLDVHSGIQQNYSLPALWTRQDLSIEGALRAK